MAYTDASPRLITEGFPGGLKVVLAEACAMGDLLGYSSGWKRADGSTPVINAILVAGEAGATAGTITAYRMARVSGYTDATPGGIAYLSDTGGGVGGTAGTNSQKVGVFVSATEALLAPEFPVVLAAS